MNNIESSQENRNNIEVNKELLDLAENFLQLHFSELSTGHNGSMSPEIADSEEDREIIGDMSLESGNGFRDWFNSPEGKAIMIDYVTNHTEEDIIKFVDMDKLEALYLEFRDRTLH